MGSVKELVCGTVAMALLCCCACAHRDRTPPAAEPVVKVLGEPATPPPGTEKMCWEEPKVTHESNGPGLDVEGKWYHPAYLATREVKMGRWVPCRPE